MSDTFTPNAKYRLPQTGAYNNTWGAVLNADSLVLIDDNVNGREEITLTGLTYSLPAMAQGSDSAARAAILRFGGSPSGTVTVTIPGTVTSKIYLVDNRCGQTVTLTYGAGATVSVPTGVRQFVQCDGTEVTSDGGGATNADTLGGVAAASYARRDLANTFLKVNSYPWITVIEAPSTIIDASAGNHQRLTLTADRIIDVPTNPADGQMLMLQVKQDAVGGRLVTAWHPNFLFENGLAPTLATTANAIDLFLMCYDSSIAKWIVGHFSSIAPATGASYNLVIEGNQCEVNLAALLGSVAVASVVNLTIAQGTVLQALSSGAYALDLSNALPAGSELNLTNLGYIIGHGGRGGNGAKMHVSNSSSVQVGWGATNGRAGGAAMRGPGSGVTFNIANANGYIRGGGGGGGGGGAGSNNFGEGGGGGGGGGAGGGLAGDGEPVTSSTGSDGVDGSTGIDGTFGSGGAGQQNGSGDGANGGDGGTWGAAGTNGATASPGQFGPGTAGAAGKAIELASGTANFISGSGSPNVMGAVS